MRGFNPRRQSGRRGMSRSSGQYCPEVGEIVPFSTCMNCSSWGVHAEGDPERCRYEFQDLMRGGFYARNEDEWLEHLRRLDPETWERLVNEKRNRERVLGEMEAERPCRGVEHEPGDDVRADGDSAEKNEEDGPEDAKDVPSDDKSEDDDWW